LRTTAYALAMSVFVTAFSARCAAAPTNNALWNDGQGFGIWLYERPGSCDLFQYKNAPYMVVGNGAKRTEVKDGTYGVKDLQVCMLVGTPDLAFCHEGYVTIRYVPSENAYVGEYDFRLSDGRRHSGEFRAQHCTPR
jgi:hypothetical protein